MAIVHQARTTLRVVAWARRSSSGRLVLVRDRTGYRRLRAWGIAILVVLVAVSLGVLIAYPRARVALRLASGFEALAADGRVFHQVGAEELARQISVALPGVVDTVEQRLGRPFAGEFRVYVCASHESFMGHIGQPASWPVRGIAFQRDVWISPQAFAFRGKDTHQGTLAHELTHLYLDQHIGWWWRVRHLPAWFVEGLADWVGGTGEEIVSRQGAIEAILAGHRLEPDTTGRLLVPRRPLDYGVSFAEFHAQSRMFVEYLHSKDGEAFEEFLGAILDGRVFERAMEKSFGMGVENAWVELVESLGD